MDGNDYSEDLVQNDRETIIKVYKGYIMLCIKSREENYGQVFVYT